MLKSMEYFIKRLRLYAEASRWHSELEDIVVDFMVELISTLAQVTQQLEGKRHLGESFLANVLLYSVRCSHLGNGEFRGQVY